jgi:hypothetical protein
VAQLQREAVARLGPTTLTNALEAGRALPRELAAQPNYDAWTHEIGRCFVLGDSAVGLLPVKSDSPPLLNDAPSEDRSSRTAVVWWRPDGTTAASAPFATSLPLSLGVAAAPARAGTRAPLIVLSRENFEAIAVFFGNEYPFQKSAFHNEFGQLAAALA